MWHHDVTNARTCQIFAVCLTVFPFEFRPRTFTIGFYGKNSIISERMILECSFPLTYDHTSVFDSASKSGGIKVQLTTTSPTCQTSGTENRGKGNSAKGKEEQKPTQKALWPPTP